jgi:hypothetical protein
VPDPTEVGAQAEAVDEGEQTRRLGVGVGGGRDLAAFLAVADRLGQADKAREVGLPHRVWCYFVIARAQSATAEGDA